MQKSRQTSIIQMFKNTSKKTSNNDNQMDQVVDPKKEEIYSSGQDSLLGIPAVPGKEKKETKLQSFLSKLDPQFVEQMKQFVISNKQDYKENPSKNITLYEDILIIWSFKNDEEEIKNKKKEAVDRLTAELEALTKKKAATIKERIQKKLSNLSVEIIRYYMENKLDFSFSYGKRQLNNLPKALGGTTQNVVSNSCEELEPPITEIKTEEKLQPEPNRLSERKNNKKVEENTASVSMFERSLYNYGTKKITERIKFYYNHSTRTLIPFKESDIKKLKQVQAEDRNKGEGEERVDTEVVEIMEKEFFKGTMNENHVKDSLFENIEEIKAKTLATLKQIESGEITQEKMKEIETLKSILQQIDQKVENVQQLQKAQSRPSPVPEEQAEESPKKEVRFDQSGKKTLPQEPESQLQSKTTVLVMSDNELKEEHERLMRKMCNNMNRVKTLAANPTLILNSLWSEEEDKLLWNFRFSPNSYSAEMKCLLRYKDVPYVLQRMRFNNVDIDAKVEKALYSLVTSVEPEKYQSFDGPNLDKQVKTLQIEQNLVE